MWSLLSQGRSAQKVKSRFLEKHEMKLISEKNKCAHSAKRAQLRNTAVGAACRKYIAGCLRDHPVWWAECAHWWWICHTQLAQWCQSSQTPSLASVPSSYTEIWTALARQLFRNILWSSLYVWNREITFFIMESFPGYVPVCCCCRKAANSEV